MDDPLTAYWQELDRGPVHECADYATARREAIEYLNRGGRPYVSHTRIPPQHGALYRQGEQQFPARMEAEE